MKKDDLYKSGTFDAAMARPDLTATAKVVYVALAGHLNNGDQWVWPSVPTLARRSGSGRRAVQISLRHLTETGLISEVGCSDLGTVKYCFQPADRWRGAQNLRGRKICGGANYAPAHKTHEGGANCAPELLQGTSPDPPPISPPPVSAGHAEASDAASGPDGTPRETSRKRTGTGPRKSAASPAAVAVAEAYRRLVQPGDRTCSPAGRACRHIDALLRSRQATAEALTACVANYAAAMEAEGTPPQYRKVGGNFFGREGVWREWTEPLTPEELRRRRDERNAHNARNARGQGNGRPGSGGFHAPGDFAGRTDAVDA